MDPKVYLFEARILQSKFAHRWTGVGEAVGEAAINHGSGSRGFLRTNPHMEKKEYI